MGGLDKPGPARKRMVKRSFHGHEPTLWEKRNASGLMNSAGTPSHSQSENVGIQ